MKLHKYCAILPKMMETEYQALKADICEHGLLEPVVVYEETILDGRHRQRICDELAIQPRYVEFESLHYQGSALDFVFSKHQRRNLTPDQKALLADKLATLKDGERQVLTGEKVTLSEALKSTGASKGQVGKLRKINKDNPAVLEQIETGRTSIIAEYKKAVKKQRSPNISTTIETPKQRPDASVANVIAGQALPNVNTDVEAAPGIEKLSTDTITNNNLPAALLQLVISLRTIKASATLNGIEATLLMMSSMDNELGANTPKLLLTTIRNDIDYLLTGYNGIDSSAKAQHFQLRVHLQFNLQVSQAKHWIKQACRVLDIKYGKSFTLAQELLMFDWLQANVTGNTAQLKVFTQQSIPFEENTDYYPVQ